MIGSQSFADGLADTGASGSADFTARTEQTTTAIRLTPYRPESQIRNGVAGRNFRYTMPPALMATIRWRTVPTSAACEMAYCLAPRTRMSGTTAATVAARTIPPARHISRFPGSTFSALHDT